jgi:pimeloyl-ACP methyl ester carboxylesterase
MGICIWACRRSGIKKTASRVGANFQSRTSLPPKTCDIENCMSELADETASGIGPSRIDIAYQRIGNSGAPAVLLIMGLGAQSIVWPDAFCRGLADRGLQVIRFDNRDTGLSTHMTDAPPPDLPAALAGDLSSASYTLSDMAGDAVALLDALGIRKAHVAGASLGGAIAQTMAIEHPGRVRSLTSMMSSTGNRSVGQAAPELLREVFGGPRAVTRDEVIARTLRISRAAGSPGYPRDETEIAERARRAYDRSYDPPGTVRQAIALVASGDRTERLRLLEIPTLVIHGLADRMCDVSGGRATAEAIPGAELFLIEGMGHDLPPALRSPIAERIAEFVLRAERS